MKMILWVFAILFLSSVAWGQDKCEAPIIGVGSNWSYKTDNGWTWTAKTVADEDGSYVDTWIMPEGAWRGEWRRHSDKTNMNCLRITIDGKEEMQERSRFKKKFDFPLYQGKKWSNRYIYYSQMRRQNLDFLEELSVLGFEDVNVIAGRFPAFKVKGTVSVKLRHPLVGVFYYWWSPVAKAMVKEDKEPGEFWKAAEYMKLELVSYELK